MSKTTVVLEGEGELIVTVKPTGSIQLETQPLMAPKSVMIIDTQEAASIAKALTDAIKDARKMREETEKL